MLVVDSSVWIDWFRDARVAHVDPLAQLRGHVDVRLNVPDAFESHRGLRVWSH